MTIPKNILQIFFSHGRQLIPISPDPPHALKRPLHDGWTENEYDNDSVIEYARQGLNLGWRLSSTDCVIDVDPRNGGEEGLRALLRDFQAHDPTIDDLADVFPTVRSGGNGWHFYGALPSDIAIKKKTQRYEGVEFVTRGAQVIIPGSMHPSGHKYEFDDFSNYDSPATPIPPWLLSHIARDDDSLNLKHQTPGELTSEQLADLLGQLDASEYSNHDDWFPLMTAAHEATNGDGRDVFVAWSLTDTSFAGHDHIIRSRWNTLTPGKAGNTGIGTLFKEVLRHGGTLPPRTLTALNSIDLGDLPPLPEGHPNKPLIKQIIDKNKLDADIQLLHPCTSSDEIRQILSRVILVDELDQSRYIKTISDQTNHTITDLRNALTQAKVQAKIHQNSQTPEDTSVEDNALEVTTHLLQNKFEGGKLLIHGADQRFWQFNQTHWEPVDDNIISNMLLKATYQVKEQKPFITSQLAPLLTQSEKLLRARRAVGVNFHESTTNKLSIVNTENCEIWIDTDTGHIAAKKHNPDSHLTSCLPVEFNPKASCPLFSRALEQMFELCTDRDEIIRHLWEVIGYIIQPNKNLAAWVLLRGEGANGKTVVLNVITALLGKTTMNTSIEDLDTKRNSHALADLPGKLCVIDEDLDSQTVLPDSMLKKLSESKTLTANPKMRAKFEFTNTAIPLFAANHWPQVKDLSHGMRRRAHVFEFNRVFKDHEQDRTLSARIIQDELGGVLVQALKGFRRLRQRGDFKIPTSCQIAKKHWLSNSNTIGLFIDEMLRNNINNTVKFAQVYSLYQLWRVNNGYKHMMNKPSFRKALEALGVEIKRGAKNHLYAYHVSLNAIEGYDD